MQGEHGLLLSLPLGAEGQSLERRACSDWWWGNRFASGSLRGQGLGCAGGHRGMRVRRPPVVRTKGDRDVASIRKETSINARPEDVWEALRDWGALHERLVPGFVVDTRLDGDDRIVTFFNGAVVREVLVDLDDDERRLVWTVVDGPYTHYNAAAQVLDDGDGRARFVWVADLLPDERGTRVVKETLEARVAGV